MENAVEKGFIGGRYLFHAAVDHGHAARQCWLAGLIANYWPVARFNRAGGHSRAVTAKSPRLYAFFADIYHGSMLRRLLLVAPTLSSVFARRHAALRRKQNRIVPHPARRNNFSRVPRRVFRSLGIKRLLFREKDLNTHRGAAMKNWMSKIFRSAVWIFSCVALSSRILIRPTPATDPQQRNESHRARRGRCEIKSPSGTVRHGNVTRKSIRIKLR